MNLSKLDDVNDTLFQWLRVSKTIGAEVVEQSYLVQRSFEAHRNFLMLMGDLNDESKLKYFNDANNAILLVETFRDTKRYSIYFNHLSAISESIAALRWVIIKPNPNLYVQEMIDIAQFYTNRILIEWKNQDSLHVQWVRLWLQLLRKLHDFVENYHPKSWFIRGEAGDASAMHLAPISNKISNKQNPQIYQDNKKVFLEYHTNNHNLILDKLCMDNVIYIYKCTEVTINVKGKVNSIIIDSCKKTNVLFEQVISSFEVINSQSIQMQVAGKVQTICVEKTDDCQIYLNEESLDVEIITSKFSGVNVLIPTSDGDYIEKPVPEQFKTKLTIGAKLVTAAVEN